MPKAIKLDGTRGNSFKLKGGPKEDSVKIGVVACNEVWSSPSAAAPRIIKPEIVLIGFRIHKRFFWTSFSDTVPTMRARRRRESLALEAFGSQAASSTRWGFKTEQEMFCFLWSGKSFKLLIEVLKLNSLTY